MKKKTHTFPSFGIAAPATEQSKISTFDGGNLTISFNGNRAPCLEFFYYLKIKNEKILFFFFSKKYLKKLTTNQVQ